MDRLETSYFAKKGNDGYETFASMFDGLRILKIDGFFERGKPVNIYTAQWVTSGGQTEDYMITTKNALDEDEVIFENANLEITFIIGDRYASDLIDVGEVHDAFIDYMTRGKLKIKSLYANKEVECVCLDSYKPTTVKLNRAFNKNWIMGTIKLHQLSLPTSIQ